VVTKRATWVAGEDDTTVQLQGTGPHYAASPVGFDPRNDVAILRVPAIAGAPSLGLDVKATRGGRPAAILGFPLNGPFTITPGRVGNTSTVCQPGRIRAGAGDPDDYGAQGQGPIGQLGWPGR